MKILILIFALFSTHLYSQVETSPELSHWKLVMEGNKGGNIIRSVERKIVTPYSQYTVGQVTMVEFNYEGEHNLESTRSFLKKEFKLTGLLEKKVENSYRFEGYRSDIRRQVVVFVSFSKNKIRVSSAFYRPTYGRTLALEVELFHLKYHNVEKKVSYLNGLNLPFSLISRAHADEDCTKCAGNPMCLMLCRSANTGSGVSVPGSDSSSSGGLFGTAGLNLDQISAELSATNTQLNALNGNIGLLNTNWGNTNTQLENSNQNWNNTNTQLGNANQNWNNTNTQVDIANQNWNNTNTQIGVFNQNYAKTNEELAKANQNMENLNNTIDKNAQAAIDESMAWRAMTEKESAEWRALMKEQSDKGIAIAEKMSDPHHLFKVATFSAAGAVLGSTVANLAISGVQSAVGFLIKWATGELHTMKQEELLKEFAQAMKVYTDSTTIAKGLEASIDAVLSNIALHKKFELQNSEVLGNIQKYIITTEFDLEDAKKDRCVEDIVSLNQQMVEFKSLAKILDMSDPQKQMCLDLKEMFRKLAEIEGVLQNARPNLLKAEEALNWSKARSQNDGDDTLDEIKKGKLADKVKKTQDKQREKLLKKNIKDTEKLVEDIEDDCYDSFKKMNLKKKEVKTFCSTLVANKDNASSSGIKSAFPNLSEDQTNKVVESFEKKYIPMGIDKVKVYESQREKIFGDFEAETNRHHEESLNLKDRMSLDPRIALDEMKAINEFTEKLMKEQAYLYTDGMKTKKARFEEACQSMK